MSSELKVNKIWPRAYVTSYIEMQNGAVNIFPKIAVDSIESLSGSVVNIEGWDSSTYVLVTGNQTIAGVKTFTSIPVLPSSSPAADDQAARKKYVDDSIAALTVFPPGSCIPYAGATAPTGFLLCDGTSYSVTTYASLFTIIGYTYGGGGATFSVPNLKGKVVVGYNSLETEFDALGETGGEKTHILTEAELAAHYHIGLNYGMGAIVPGAGGSGLYGGGGVATTTTVGSSTAHNNLQPYIALNYIIKY